jgi:scyllo-inositol 2-dehydrogenase (NADP+)
MLNVGLVGYGAAGRVFHAPVIRAVEGLHLTTIVRRRGAPDPPLSDVEFVRDLDALLARPVDMVVVATPNSSHHPIAKQCLLAGRHVVIDKPFTVSVPEAEELVRLSGETGRVLSVYQNRRYAGDFVTLRGLLASGALGRVTAFESHFDRFRPQRKPSAWREQALPGSGIWFDLGAHLLDQALVLFGIPRAISADIRLEREGAVADDAFDVALHYPHMRALLRASMLAISPGPTFAVHGTRGSFVKYGFDPQEAALQAGRTPGDPGWDSEPPELYGTLTTEEGARRIPTIPSSFARYYENVRDAILGAGQLAVSPGEALDVMRGLELAATSSREGCVRQWTRAP